VLFSAQRQPPGAQLLPALHPPSTRINLAYEHSASSASAIAVKITHVEPESLATFLEAATDEECKALQLSQVGSVRAPSAWSMSID